MTARSIFTIGDEQSRLPYNPDAIEAMDALLEIVRSGKRVCLLSLSATRPIVTSAAFAAVVAERTGGGVDNLMPEP